LRAKSSDKRLAIVKAAFEVVSERGYMDATVDDIAQHAGVAKGTVYLYFKDKPAIYVGLLEWLVGQALELLTKVKAQPIPPRQKLEQMFSIWSTGVFSRPAVIALLSMENVQQSDKVMGRFRKQVLPHIHQLTGTIADVIAEGIKCGEFRPVDPRLAAIMYMNAFGAGIHAVRHQRLSREVADSARELFFCGLLASGGRPAISEPKESH
jgi:AcrR family transcriptional regulator